jgi:hypothetical protein
VVDRVTEPGVPTYSGGAKNAYVVKGEG